MTLNELKERQVKAQAKVEKIESIIAKKYACHLTQEEIKIVESTMTLHYIDASKELSERLDDEKFEYAYDLRSKLFDLRDAKKTLDNYNEKIAEKEAFANASKIEAIWEFCQEWKKEARKYYIQMANKYIELYDGYWDAWRKVKGTLQYYSRKHFDREYFVGIQLPMMDKIVVYHTRIDEDKLDAILEQEMEARYQEFIDRIENVGGKIIKVLTMEVKFGMLNGVVKCEKGNVKVNTIDAGGYNIQCYHYRVLVDLLK